MVEFEAEGTLLQVSLERLPRGLIPEQGSSVLLCLSGPARVGQFELVSYDASLVTDRAEMRIAQSASRRTRPEKGLRSRIANREAEEMEGTGRGRVRLNGRKPARPIKASQDVLIIISDSVAMRAEYWYPLAAEAAIDLVEGRCPGIRRAAILVGADGDLDTLCGATRAGPRTQQSRSARERLGRRPSLGRPQDFSRMLARVPAEVRASGLSSPHVVMVIANQRGFFAYANLTPLGEFMRKERARSLSVFRLAYGERDVDKRFEGFVDRLRRLDRVTVRRLRAPVRTGGGEAENLLAEDLQRCILEAVSGR